MLDTERKLDWQAMCSPSPVDWLLAADVSLEGQGLDFATRMAEFIRVWLRIRESEPKKTPAGLLINSARASILTVSEPERAGH